MSIAPAPSEVLNFLIKLIIALIIQQSSYIGVTAALFAPIDVGGCETVGYEFICICEQCSPAFKTYYRAASDVYYQTGGEYSILLAYVCLPSLNNEACGYRNFQQFVVLNSGCEEK